jgi:hypothetical protein
VATEAVIRVDGGGLFYPAVSKYGGPQSEAVGTPAIDSGLLGDVYLTFDAIGGTGPTTGATAFPNLPSGSIAIGVVIEPLLAWMWAGGLVIGLGGLMALLPGSRRRSTDPVSAPAPVVVQSPAVAGAPGRRMSSSPASRRRSGPSPDRSDGARPPAVAEPPAVVEPPAVAEPPAVVEPVGSDAP